MRLTLFLVFISTFQLLAENSYSQSARFTLEMKNVTIKDVLSQMEEQSNFYFLYDNGLIDVYKKVDIVVQNEPINEILNKLFGKGEVDLEIRERHIIITPAKIRVVQQNLTISGIVNDSNGLSLPGVTVVVKGTTQGTITDMDGNYTLTDVPGDAILVFSFVGMKSIEVPVSGRSTIDAVLAEETIGLEEVVAIGYGSVKKSDLTGSLTSVNSDDFKEQNVTRVDQALQGRASGVQISNTAGAPGGDVRIRIRGANSVLGDNSPLFVVDGFVGVDFNMINPNDIKSMEVLKDAASTAIYGSRGANGVILITTKNGNKDGKVSVDYQGSVSLSSVVKKYDKMSAAEFAETVNEKNLALGLDPYFSQAQLSEYQQNGGYDYQDEIFSEAISNQHQLSVSGGTEKTQYRISANYVDQKGIVNNSDYNQINFRTNIASQYNEKLSFRFTMNGASTVGLNTQSRTGGEGNPIVQTLAWAPTTNPYDGEGGYTLSDPVGSIKTNPLAIIYDTENRNEKTFANLVGGINYELVDGLSVDFQAGADLSFRTLKTFGGNYATNYNPIASITSGKSINFQTTSQISYAKEFNEKHRINAVAVFESQEYRYNYSMAAGAMLKFPDLKYDNLAQSESYNIGSGFTKWTLLSYLGRINYSLMDKYLLSVSVRHDGSSKFAEGHKYSTFPSAALAWNMGRESFISDLNAFSSLKLRLSWGLTGSQAIDPYSTWSTYNTDIYYAFATGDQTSGIQIGDPGNNMLKWETTEQKDLGLEAKFFDGRLTMEFDYFIKDTRDLLLNKSVPFYSGGGSMTSNVGKIRNTGWDFSLGGKIISKEDISWNSDFNISHVKNEVVSLGDETRIFSQPDLIGFNGQPEFIYAVGQPLGSFWGLKYLGPWGANESAEAAKFGQVPGDARYQDLNGDNVIDGSDYQIIGNGLPATTLGWNNTINIKKFVINMFFQGVFGFDKQNYTRAVHLMGARDARQATLSEIRDRYIPGVNEDAYLPAFSESSLIEPQSSICLENGGFMRLKNLSVAYNFKLKNATNMKVYVSGSNLLTFTKYKGIDPESSNVGGDGSDINQSVDYGSYPNSRTFTLGVDFNF
ncbi:SusC/RagA family TonB-linked outer membrane protein [Sunxiuqinia sp. A32]|uniref:SusC/RagA family TonB-linked outer membrane protein n=1 Tax=Sunxiuqinia sp. A32 TaxID=3461496 RepID=UPI0040463237